MKNLWNILGIIGERKKYIFLLALRTPFDFLLNLSQVFFLRDAFGAIEKGSQADLYRACVFYGVASLLLFSYNSIVWRIFSVMYVQIAGKTRIAAANSIMEHSLSQVEKGSSGDFLTRLNLDAGMTIMILGGVLNIPHFVIAVFSIICTSLMLVGMNLKIFFIVMSFVIPHVILNWFVVAKPMTDLQEKVLQAKGRMNTILSSMITMADTAVLYDAKPMLIRSYRRESREVMQLKMVMTLKNAFGSALILLFGLMGYLVLLLYSGGAIASGNMLFGELIAITKLQSGILMGLFMGIRSSVHIRMNLAGLHRINELLVHKKGVTF
ncbi:MAG TPA: ABC transporter transmembrane domain-containing protein [Lachnospiraceae bacterium]|nr:ABC transporter transmembrane domain-containing protein [Lachnospiraceae bacterium]